jgi:hypothetical protein
MTNKDQRRRSEDVRNNVRELFLSIMRSSVTLRTNTSPKIFPRRDQTKQEMNSNNCSLSKVAERRTARTLYNAILVRLPQELGPTVPIVQHFPRLVMLLITLDEVRRSNRQLGPTRWDGSRNTCLSRVDVDSRRWRCSGSSLGFWTAGYELLNDVEKPLTRVADEDTQVFAYNS